MGSCQEDKDRKVIHTGILRAVIPANTLPTLYCPELKDVSKARLKLGNGLGTSRNDRYLVEVPRIHKQTGKQLKPYWYGPSLQKVHRYQNQQNGTNNREDS